MPNSSLHPKLAHLSDSQITDLITRYYAGARIADLLAEYAIDCHPPQLYKLFPPVIHSSTTCPNCGAVMMSKHVARSVGMADSKTLHCSQCRHETSFRCKCDYCRNRGKIKNGRFSHTPFSNQTFEAQGVTSQVLKPDHLTLEQAIALLALARCNDFVDSHGRRISVPDLTAVPVAPRGGYAKELIERLSKADFFGSVPESHYFFDALKDEELKALQFSMRWNIQRYVRIELLQQIEQCARTMVWPSHWLDQLSDMKRTLAFAECQEFYDFCAKQRGLPPSAQRSTAMMLNNLLQDHSVAQCYRIIYAGAQAAADFLVRTSCAGQHAANYMIGACQRWVDRARSENWVVTPFRRNLELPRSMVNYVLYDDFLKCGDDGFNLALDKITRPNA
jgi:hypothetical protein